MKNLYQLSVDELKADLKERGLPAFRAKQIWSWVYEKGARSFDEMSNLPKALRQSLQESYGFGELQVDTEQCSADGTIKRLYRLTDGRLIESVLMPYADGRRTACISSQVGCAMGCVFCATGQMGFVRQLKPHEIFEQAMHFACILKSRGERLSNIVLMGMGEPFHNYDAVLAGIGMLRTRLNIGARKITLSTVGLAPKIRRFATEGVQVNLAISLHATTDTQRSALMPINKRYDIAELISACKEYSTKTNRRITFEWAQIEGENDSIAEAHRLGALLKGLDCHINIIPLNPTEGYTGRPSSNIKPFIDTLSQYGIVGTMRVRRGLDIDAGCCQLKSKVVREKSCRENL